MAPQESQICSGNFSDVKNQPQGLCQILRMITIGIQWCCTALCLTSCRYCIAFEMMLLISSFIVTIRSAWCMSHRCHNVFSIKSITSPNCKVWASAVFENSHCCTYLLIIIKKDITVIRYWFCLILIPTHFTFCKPTSAWCHLNAFRVLLKFCKTVHLQTIWFMLLIVFQLHSHYISYSVRVTFTVSVIFQ